MEKEKRIINQIQKVRAKNNILWMSLLRIAFKYSPEEARIIFKDIVHNDSEINKLSKELCE